MKRTWIFARQKGTGRQRLPLILFPVLVLGDDVRDMLFQPLETTGSLHNELPSVLSLYRCFSARGSTCEDLSGSFRN